LRRFRDQSSRSFCLPISRRSFFLEAAIHKPKPIQMATYPPVIRHNFVMFSVLREIAAKEEEEEKKSTLENEGSTNAKNQAPQPKPDQIQQFLKANSVQFIDAGGESIIEKSVFGKVLDLLEAQSLLKLEGIRYWKKDHEEKMFVHQYELDAWFSSYTFTDRGKISKENFDQVKDKIDCASLFVEIEVEAPSDSKPTNPFRNFFGS